MEQGRRRLWYAVLLLICATAFLLAALLSWDIFERIPHVEDEAAYLFQAQVFAQGRLSVSTPPYPASYWSPFVIDHQGRRFGKYPPGYPLLLSLGVRIGEAWIINALLGALALWLIAQSGRVIYSSTTGLLAAALGLTSPVFLAESSTLLSHPTTLCFTALFLWASTRRIQKPDGEARQYLLVAGLGLGYVLLTRPFDAIGIGLPFAVYSLVRVLRGDRAFLGQSVIIAALVVLFALALPLYWHLLTGDFVNPYRLVWPYDRPGFGPEAGLKGHTLATGLFYARYNLRAVANNWLGWPGYLNVVLLVLPFVLRPREGWNYLLLASFASLVGLHVTYWHYGGHDAGFPRYYYAALPMLLLLSARGLETTTATLGRLSLKICLPSRRKVVGRERRNHIGPLLTKLALYLALVGLVLYNSLVFLPEQLNAFRGKTGITAAPLQVVQEAGLTNAIVLVTGYEHWWDFAVFFAANSPTLDSDVVYAIYHNQQQAQAVRALYPDRPCYVQSENRLIPCPF